MGSTLILFGLPLLPHAPIAALYLVTMIGPIALGIF